VCLWIWLTCLLLTPVIHANERADLKSQISALEAENARYEAEIDRLDENVAWLRSLIEQEDADGQIQP
jgi:cell division protein FtsB